MNGWRMLEMEKNNCGKCGAETSFLGYDPRTKKELCLKCYVAMMSGAGKSDGMTSPIK